MLMVLASAVFLACTKSETKKEEKSSKDGYNVVQSENIELVKKLNEASLAYDSTTVLSMYSSPEDTVHNNINKITAAESVKGMAPFKAKNIKMSIKNYGALWEVINPEPNAKGQKNFVIAYIVLNISNGKENKDVLFHQTCAIKDGKIVEEWDIYDSKDIEAILN
jgi:hypothetical protein